jgi:hypothetical protein
MAIFAAAYSFAIPGWLIAVVALAALVLAAMLFLLGRRP